MAPAEFAENDTREFRKMKSKAKWARNAGLILVAAVVLYAAMRPELSFNNSESGRPLPSTVAAASGRVTMIDLGATECIPCKMMAPIIEELRKEYAGKADILFIDVWKDPEQARKYGIRAIPTQIFFDGNGQEVFRNTGFMDKQRIVDALAKLGVS
jgi:thioredoxin 1